MRRRLLGALAAALTLSRLRPASAAPAPQAAAGTPRLKAVIIEIMPFGWRGADGRARGLAAEVSQRLALESGLAIDNVVVPYPRGVAMVTSGEADIMISLMNSELEHTARHLGVLFGLDAIIIGRAGMPLASLADLRGRTVGHLRRAEYSPALLSAESGIQRYETSSSEQTINMLSKGRLDAALGIRMSLYHAVRTLHVPPGQLGQVLYLGKREVGVYYSVRRYTPEVAARLKRGIEAMRQNGSAAQLVAKFDEGPQPAQR